MSEHPGGVIGGFGILAGLIIIQRVFCKIAGEIDLFFCGERYRDYL